MWARERWLRRIAGIALTAAISAALGCTAFQASMMSAASAVREASRPTSRWSEPVDIAELRARYSESAELRERCESERPIDQAFEHLDRREWSRLLALTAPWLDRCPIDIDFHRLRARALYEVDRRLEAGHHMTWYHALVEAALDSGDGATPESAYVVLSRGEELALMRALELTALRQIWVTESVHGFEVQSQTGSTFKVYFNPSTRMSRLLREAPLESEPARP